MTPTTEQEQVIVTAGTGSAPSLDILGDMPERRIRWSAIIGSVIVAAGVWLLLHALGLGIGLTALDPEHASSLRGVGIGTGIWSIIVPILALFLGGLVAGYLAGIMPRMSAVVHGGVLWSLATILSLLILLSTLSGLLTGVARLSGQVVGAAGGVAMQSIAGLDDASLGSVGLSANDLLVPVNARLREAGKPPITADELRAAAEDVLRTAVREGRFDRELLVQSLAQNTSLTREDAQEVAATIEQQWQQQAGALSQRAGELGSSAETAALQAAESTGKALIVLFFLMAAGLVAAIGGVLLAVSRQERYHHQRITT